MAEFKDISQFTKVTPSGTEEIQISATQKAALSDIAKLSKPDNVPTTEQMNSAITSALYTFETQKVKPIADSMTLIKGEFIEVAQSSNLVDVTGGGERHFLRTGEGQNQPNVTVQISEGGFYNESDAAVVILPKKVTPTFEMIELPAACTLLKSKMPDPDPSNNTDYIVYVIQLLYRDESMGSTAFAINGADYTATELL